MRGYKGFKNDLSCRGKQYAIGETFTEEETKLCVKGMHFCLNPHDVFHYYHPTDNNKFCLVKAEDVDSEESYDSKRVCKKLTIKAELSPLQLCKLSVPVLLENSMFFDKINKMKSRHSYSHDHAVIIGNNREEINVGKQSAISVESSGIIDIDSFGSVSVKDDSMINAESFGSINTKSHSIVNAGSFESIIVEDFSAVNAKNNIAVSGRDYNALKIKDHGAANVNTYGTICAGNYSAANANNGSVVIAGDCSAANVCADGVAKVGEHGVANAGYYGEAITGNHGVANVDYKGKAIADDYSVAKSGDYGESSVGNNSIAVSSNEGKVKGDIGSLLILYNHDNFGNITDYAVKMVDGENIKADTWYCLKKGKFTEFK